MTRVAKVSLGLLLLVTAALAIWRVVATSMSDRLAELAPRQALEWDRDNPAAMLALAQQQLEQGDPRGTRDTADALLAREPLRGQGIDFLAEAAKAQGDKSQAWLLSTIALRRAPHSLAPRAWLAGELLAQGKYADALEGIDRILRISPGENLNLLPVLAELSENPKFAEVMAAKLAAEPIWRNQFLDILLLKGSLKALDLVMPALHHRNALRSQDLGRWIDRLVSDGAWGEAYARWASAAKRNDKGQLANVYNGDFELAIEGTGFDWRIGDSAGVIIDRIEVASASGSHAVSLMFLGRRVDAIPLHHWLMLAAGTYELRFRATARDLRGDRGVEWVIRCQGNAMDLVASERLNGSFDWKNQAVQFEVPNQGCLAQDLWLRNAGAEGAGKIIRGTIDFDDFDVERIDKQTTPQAPGTVRQNKVTVQSGS